MPNLPRRSTGYAWIAGSAPNEHKPQAFARVVDKRYNSKKWRKQAKAFIALHPICATPNCNALSAVCDHITPVVDGGDFWLGPFQALCHRCHNRKSSNERARRKY